ncbi:sterol desaturase family protein [Rubrivivax rivuli]|uniref:Fatty acid hydroxylase family protein n=1 Tax=Rubrivivax rivuli TaxID=1862385 RepID=A0A437R9C2_9BURK|nr:sterol desaturase family protein [Rubrivivax rivuli]RVU43381.1 fatty acid hydroxylase family protein [Rubrivivax rivuli]
MTRHLVRRWTYPAVAGGTLLYLGHVLSQAGAPPAWQHGAFIVVLVAVLLSLEVLWPLDRRWGMTRALLVRRDMPYLLINAATIATANAAAAWLIWHHGLTPPITWLRDLPVVPAAALTLLVTDGLWYAVHRASHEGRGWLGAWLWRVHMAHHLPQQVYVVMHVVGHPINAVIVRLLLTVPPWLLGVSPEALYVANVVTAVQGLVSHFNVDSRAGWFNHLLVGTELHRWHHAVGVQGNYAAVLSVWDRLFGTLVYRPGENPGHLGVDDPDHLPRDTDWRRVLWAPLRRQ